MSWKKEMTYFRLRDQTIMELENINTKNTRNVATAKSKLILSILHWI